MLMSVGLLLESEGREDQLSPRQDGEVEMFPLTSAVEIGTAAVGVAVETGSSFGFFFCSCWFPERKLPTTT